MSIAEETESTSEDEDHVGVKKHHVEDSTKERSRRKQAETKKKEDQKGKAAEKLHIQGGKEQGTSEPAEFMAAIRSMAMPKLPPYSGKDDPGGERLEKFVKEFERHSSIAG